MIFIVKNKYDVKTQNKQNCIKIRNTAIDTMSFKIQYIKKTIHRSESESCIRFLIFILADFTL